MVDVPTDFAETRDLPPPIGAPNRYLLDSDDLRSPMSDCQCLNCKKIPKEVKFRNVFVDYHIIPTKDHSTKELPLHTYLLFPDFIPAYVFKTRRWGM